MGYIMRKNLKISLIIVSYKLQNVQYWGTDLLSYEYNTIIYSIKLTVDLYYDLFSKLSLPVIFMI